MIPPPPAPAAPPPEPPPAGTSPRTTAPRWPIAAWACLYLALGALLHFVLLPVPVDADSAYHAVVGRLIGEHGLLQSFPWTPFSWLADHYSDKELLFHLLFVPVAGLPWATAAHAVGALCGALALLALYLVLRVEGVRLAGLWALVPLAASPAFVFRFSLVRPHLLSIALGLVTLWAAGRRRLVWLALAAALYPASYVAWPLPLLLVAIAEAARWLAGERPRWQPFVAVGAGLAVGVGLHPNRANLVTNTWLQIVDVLFVNAWGNAGGLQLGDEFRAFGLGEWARLLPAAVALLLGALLLAWRHRRGRPEGLAFALAALAFGLLTVRTARFAEYFVPFAAAALALGLRDVTRRWVAPAVMVACLAAGAPESVGLLRDMGRKAEVLPAPLAARLAAAIPPGAQVFTCEWGLTGILMDALPDRRFVVALDPTYFLRRDPELYRLWYELPRRAPPELARTIRERFGATFVVCPWEAEQRAFFDRLAFEPGVRTLFVDDVWNAYQLAPP